ncbi:hypothetical protein SSBR45G_46740 [Bradyrhizobium sp. SSBR45G]|uniref:hypothetical protein n=1 Tax=unclassified Bradyrhizobium TaxID=2631580 RepID=UPI002342B3A6|nr:MULTISPECIES: hypothetical protein [unclassified Bradyrhizobium]GLH79765.1 hypothetical protein SSBR45G_46740 [Bradyrhizobium sp. SSBR45G]GLH87117.1 hypothetical protein SSBR45R_45770 [Bradyrhizobium sp. SSBR45R]
MDALVFELFRKDEPKLAEAVQAAMHKASDVKLAAYEASEPYRSQRYTGQVVETGEKTIREYVDELDSPELCRGGWPDTITVSQLPDSSRERFVFELQAYCLLSKDEALAFLLRKIGQTDEVRA